MSELTIAQAKEAKAALETEIARLIAEFGIRCQCEVKGMHVFSLVRVADFDIPVVYRVEVDVKL